MLASASNTHGGSRVRESRPLGSVRGAFSNERPYRSACGTSRMTRTSCDIEFEWGAKIPLRDGILLNGTVYRPKGARAPSPCVFTLTPYASDTYHERGAYFAA